MSLAICDCGGMIRANGCSDCQFKGNFKPKIMNEYAGFKVGDTVEIAKCPPTWASLEGFNAKYPLGEKYPFTGVIEKFETGEEFGHYCYALISGFGFMFSDCVKHNNIKKLHKYAVGDRVRRHNKSAILCNIETVLPDNTYTLSDCGDLKFNESDLMPFDGFRVGDTICTPKRGKGRIIGKVNFPHDGRVAVDFFDDTSLHLRWFDDIKYPKLSNLLTEQEYKEAIKPVQIGEIMGVYFYENAPTPDNPYFGKIQVADWELNHYAKSTPGKMLFVADKPNREGNRLRTSKFGVGEKVLYCCQTALVTKITCKDDKFYYDLNSNSFPDNIGEDALLAWSTPKFKQGDVVYYESPNKRIDETCKWVVVSSEKFGNVVIEQKSAGLVACISETKLRLWVDTKLTHGLHSDGVTWVKAYDGQYKIDSDWTITFLGRIVGHDTFLCTTKKYDPCLFRGVAGDDIITFNNL